MYVCATVDFPACTNCSAELRATEFLFSQFKTNRVMHRNSGVEEINSTDIEYQRYVVNNADSGNKNNNITRQE